MINQQKLPIAKDKKQKTKRKKNEQNLEDL